MTRPCCPRLSVAVLGFAALAAASVLPAAAGGQELVTFEDGLDHIIPADPAWEPTEPVQVVTPAGLGGRTSLEVRDHAELLGRGGGPSSTPALAAVNSDLTVRGGVFRGGTSDVVTTSRTLLAGNALDVTGTGITHISGGRFISGDFAGQPVDQSVARLGGEAARFDFDYSTLMAPDVHISGGTFVGSDITDSSWSERAADAVVVRGGQMHITGGTFGAGAVIDAEENVLYSRRHGTALDVRAYTNYEFKGDLIVIPTEVLIEGGVFTSRGGYSMSVGANSYVQVTGGRFESAYGQMCAGDLTIAGGTFVGNPIPGEAPARFVLSWLGGQASILPIVLTLVGSDFMMDGEPLAPGEYSFDGDIPGNVRISGMLADGSGFDADIYSFSGPLAPTLRIVPEPGMLLLPVLALAGLGRRR